MKDYLQILYNDTKRTHYLYSLAKYLYNRFDLKKNQKLIDIGCGRGDFLKTFTFYGLDCTGVDSSDQSVQDLVEYGVKKCNLEEDALPYEDDYFDVVYHKSVIEHLADPSNLMKESLRILKPGGRLIVLTPEWKSQINTFYDDYTHVRPYTVTSLEYLFRHYGCVDIQTERFYQLPLLWRHSYLKILARLLQLFCPIEVARKMGSIRWLVELMAMATAKKEE